MCSAATFRAKADFDGFGPGLACGAELGAKYALAICGDMDWTRTVDNLGRLCALAAEHGLVPAIEAPLHERIIGGSLERTLQLIEEAGRTAVVCLDTYQVFRTGDSLELVQRQPERFPYVQLADGFASPVATRLAGQGLSRCGPCSRHYRLRSRSAWSVCRPRRLQLSRDVGALGPRSCPVRAQRLAAAGR